ncbi:MAG TPA: thioredoxin [Thermoanaerobaculia bacterium]|nr:thioredoxin [Thermoanaerobaculia bacterium]
MPASDTTRDVHADTFEEEVLLRSHQVPVLVDFWAPWCGPCRTLGPILERLAAEMDGAFVLAKVDSDQNPEIAARYGVRGIPNVLLFEGGEAVDGFVGALPEPQVRAFLRRHCATEADRLVEAGKEALAADDLDAARARFEEARALDVAHHGAALGLARVALRSGELERARELAEAIPLGTDQHEPAQALLAALALVAKAHAAGSEDQCAARVAADDRDLEARFALGGYALARGDVRAALEHYLAVTERDKTWNDEAGRRAMVDVFQIIGVREPLADEYRDRLRRTLY